MICHEQLRCEATQLSLPLASEVIFDSEVYFVSEVLPCGRVANLTSLLQKQKLHCGTQLHFELSVQNFTKNTRERFCFEKFFGSILI